jgi:hypothetical protein
VESTATLNEGRRKKEEGRRKKEEGRRKKEEGRRKKEEGTRKKEEGRRKKEEGRRFIYVDWNPKPRLKTGDLWKVGVLKTTTRTKIGC